VGLTRRDINMTLKEALKFMFLLFFVITTTQVAIIVMVTEYIVGSGSGVDIVRFYRAIFLSVAAVVPVLILAFGKGNTIRAILLRYTFHFVATTASIYGVWWLTWSFSRINVTALTASYIPIYVLANIWWYRHTKNHRVRLQEEEALARSEAKSLFMAHMSHEIRTPIVSVLGLAELQYHKNHESPEAREAFLQIYTAASNLTDILNSILDLSKIEADKMEINKIAFNMPSLLQDVTQLHAAYLEKKNLRFKLNLDEHLPVELIGDEMRIRQVLTNLLSNSFKYTDIGMVQLSISYQPRDDANYVNLIAVVEDTGCGMTPEQLKVLQEEDYVRFSETDHPYVSGTGLGISITQKIVALMDAKLNISSKANVGTRIEVIIPLEVASDTPIGHDMARQLERFEVISAGLENKAIPLPWAKVLIVDDIESNLYVINGLLKLYELNVETCTSGAAAIAKIKAGASYDIIFMDYMMPEMDGITATNMLRSMGYSGTIIAISANVFDEQRNKFLASGFEGFLPKPIKTDMLHEMLVKYIKTEGRPMNISPAEQKGDIDDYYNRPETQAVIRKGFLGICGNVIGDIKKAMAGGDNTAAMIAAHSVKSYALMLGEDRLAELAKGVEFAFAKSEGLAVGMLEGLEAEVLVVADRQRGM